MMNDVTSLVFNIFIILLAALVVFVLDYFRTKREFALRNSLLTSPDLKALAKKERFNANLESITWSLVLIFMLWRTVESSQPLELSSDETFSTNEIVLLPPPNLESSSSAPTTPPEISTIPSPQVDEIKKPIVAPPVEPSKPVDNPNPNNNDTQGTANNPNATGQGASKIDAPLSINSDNDVLFMAEDMPSFPGCEEKGSDEERQRCTEEKMLKYIYANLKYPQLARDKGIQGQVWIEFVVEKDGSVSNVTIKKDLKGGCGEAAQTAVKGMNEAKIKWTPGKQRGRPVKVKYTLPINFKLK